MANKPKKGLTYFPFETDFFGDIKIRKLIKYQSSKAISVYANLLCNIYKDGYYIKWDKELPFMISETTGLDEAYINEVIKCCFNIGLFSEKMFNENQVLTSKGIQDRYILICKQLKRTGNVTEYSVNSSEDMPINSESILNTSESIPQRKEKEKKEKERKLNLPFDSENFINVWNKLLLSKKWRKKEGSALQQSLDKLAEYPEHDAIKMMENSIAGEWQGLFELKPHERVQQSQMSNVQKILTANDIVKQSYPDESVNNS